MTLIDAARSTFRRLHYSPRTEEAYLFWSRALIRFHRCHPRELSAARVTAFLNHLAVERRVAASTQNQVLCAVLFLYRRVLDLPMPELQGLERARRPEHLPAVLSRREVFLLLDQLDPAFRDGFPPRELYGWSKQAGPAGAGPRSVSGWSGSRAGTARRGPCRRWRTRETGRSRAGGSGCRRRCSPS